MNETVNEGPFATFGASAMMDVYCTPKICGSGPYVADAERTAVAGGGAGDGAKNAVIRAGAEARAGCARPNDRHIPAAVSVHWSTPTRKAVMGWNWQASCSGLLPRKLLIGRFLYR